MKTRELLGRIARIAALEIAGILLLLFMWLQVGAGLMLIPVNCNAAPDGGIAVYLKCSDVHTDIVVPTRTSRIDWSAVVPHGGPGWGSDYLAFGWGSRDFYLNVPTWDDLTLGIAFRAISGMGGTALHTRYMCEPAEGANCRRLSLSSEQYNALVEYILSSGKHNADGTFVHIDQGGGGWSNAFYEGTGRYSLFCTCNSWANSALKACGQRCCLWTPIQQPIFWQYPLDRPKGAAARVVATVNGGAGP